MDIAGFILTIFGFTLTLWQLWRTQNAAEAAREAAEKVQRDMMHFNAVSEIASTISAMEEIKRLQRVGAWEVLLDRYASVRRSLIQVKAGGANLNNNQKVYLQGAIQYFAGLERLVEESMEKQEPLQDVSKLNALVSEQIGNVAQVLAEVRERNRVSL